MKGNLRLRDSQTFPLEWKNCSLEICFAMWPWSCSNNFRERFKSPRLAPGGALYLYRLQMKFSYKEPLRKFARQRKFNDGIFSINVRIRANIIRSTCFLTFRCRKWNFLSFFFGRQALHVFFFHCAPYFAHLLCWFVIEVRFNWSVKILEILSNRTF